MTYFTVVSYKMHPMAGIHFGGTEIACIYTHFKDALKLLDTLFCYDTFRKFTY